MHDSETIMPSTLNLAVIIPVFNRKNVTLSCLDQLMVTKRDDLDIIVVDDGSTDGTSDAIQRNYPSVHIVRGSGDWWYTRSINEGLQFALANTACECFLLLNNDINFSDSYIDTVINILKKNKDETIIFGSVSFNSEDAGRPVFLGIKNFIPWLNKQYCYSLDEYVKALSEGKEVINSVFLPGRGMFFSKKTLTKNGFLNQDFPQYASDFEFSARGRQSGIKTKLCLHAVLYSHENLTGAGSPKNKPSFHQFIKSLFNKYSPTYPINNYKLIKMLTDKPALMPLTFVIILSGKFKAYIKYKYKFQGTVKESVIS